jgi:thioredoxin-like negative regulator of GroEL
MIDTVIRLEPGSYDTFTSANDCLVIVYKERCPYCEVVFKVISKCLAGYPTLKTAGINSEEHPEILSRLGASKVPTIIVYAKGMEKGRRSGVMNPTELSALIEKMA